MLSTKSWAPHASHTTSAIRRSDIRARKAISTFFSEGEGAVLCPMLTPEQWADITHFEGMPTRSGSLTHQFNGRRPGGFAMTYSMLASIVKYPYESSLAGANGKFRILHDRNTDIPPYRRRARSYSPPSTGRLARYCRHPLVYIVEAADDICYQVMDMEDAHKLHVVSTREVTDMFLGFFSEERRSRMMEIMDKVADPNERKSPICARVSSARLSANAHAHSSTTRILYCAVPSRLPARSYR